MRKFANISNFENLSNHVKYDTTLNAGCTGRGCGKGNGKEKEQDKNNPGARKPAIVRDDDENADTWAGALKRMQMGKPTVKDMYKWWR